MYIRLRNEKQGSNIIIISLIFISLYVFFDDMLSSKVTYILIIMIVASQFTYLILNRYMTISKDQIISIVLIILIVLSQIVSANFSVFKDNSINITVFRIAIMFIGALFFLNGNWYKYGVRIILIFASIHVFFTIFEYISPESFFTIASRFLSAELFGKIRLFFTRGTYSGITNQTGRNSFYITVAISILYSSIIKTNVKPQAIQMLAFITSILALLLTGKRGPLLANMLVMLFMYIYKEKARGKKILIKTVRFLFIMTLVFIFLFLVFPEALSPIKRTIIKRAQSNVVSGRMDLYVYALDLFKRKPIFGWGANAYMNFYGFDTHNIYLQMLSENGIIGFVLFISFVIFNLLKTFKTLKFVIQINDNNKTYLYFSLYTQLYFIFYGLSGNTFSDNFIFIVYLIASSIPFSLKIYSKEKMISKNFKKEKKKIH